LLLPIIAKDGIIVNKKINTTRRIIMIIKFAEFIDPHLDFVAYEFMGEKYLVITKKLQGNKDRILEIKESIQTICKQKA
jgi:hypothetical protein